MNSAYKITVTITTHTHTHVLCVTIDMLVIDSYRTSKRTPDELENKDEHNKYECQHNSYNSVIFLWSISEDLQQISIYDIIFVMNWRPNMNNTGIRWWWPTIKSYATRDSVSSNDAIHKIEYALALAKQNKKKKTEIMSIAWSNHRCEWPTNTLHDTENHSSADNNCVISLEMSRAHIEYMYIPFNVLIFIAIEIQ